MPKNTKVDEYIEKLPKDQKAIATKLRQLIVKGAAKAEEEVKWGMPCYALNGQLCYIQKAKDHVKLGFNHGAELDDPSGLLEGSGKGMRHVKVSEANYDEKALKALVQQAVKLNK